MTNWQPRDWIVLVLAGGVVLILLEPAFLIGILQLCGVTPVVRDALRDGILEHPGAIIVIIGLYVNERSKSSNSE